MSLPKVVNNYSHSERHTVSRSTSSWYHGVMNRLIPRKIAVAPAAMIISLFSGQSAVELLLERNAISSCLLIGSRKKSVQFSGSLFSPATFLWTLFPRFYLVYSLMLLGMYVSHTISTIFIKTWSSYTSNVTLLVIGSKHNNPIDNLHINRIRKIILGVLGQNIHQLLKDGSHCWSRFPCYSSCAASRCTGEIVFSVMTM